MELYAKQDFAKAPEFVSTVSYQLTKRQFVKAEHYVQSYVHSGLSVISNDW